MAKSNRRANGEGSIFPLKDGRYKAQLQVSKSFDGKRKFITKTFKTKREASEWLRDTRTVQGKLSKDEYVEFPIASLMQIWFEWKEREKLKPKSLDRIESMVNTHIIPRIGQYKLNEITADIIQFEIIDEMTEKGLSYSSVKKAKEDLNNFFNFCIRKKWILENPMLDVHIDMNALPEAKKLEGFDEDEVVRIIEIALERHGNGELKYKCGYAFPIMIETGLRTGEMLGLRWENVNLMEKYIDIKETIIYAKKRSTDSNSRVQINQKSAKTQTSIRRIPLTDKAVEYFEAQKKHRYFGEEYFVFNIDDPNRIFAINPSNLRRAFDKILKKAGLPHKGLHSLRHTFATHTLNKNNGDIFVVSRLLGHSSVQTTELYLDTQYNKLKQAIERKNT